jgi:hypothetical protein
MPGPRPGHSRLLGPAIKTGIKKAGIAPAVVLRVCILVERPGRARPYPGYEGYFFFAFLAFFAFFAFFAFLAIVSSQGLMD